jgi:hypothetical protein
MKRIIRRGLSLVIVFAVLAVGSASGEGTGPKVTLRTAAGPLKRGDPLIAFSSNMVFVTTAGNVECTSNTLSGTMRTNTKEKPSGTIEKEESIGGEPEGLCKTTSPFGPASLAVSNLPWKLKFFNTGKVQLNTGTGDKKIRIISSFPAAGSMKCIFTTKRLLAAFPLSEAPVPLEIAMTNQVLHLDPASTTGCPNEAKLYGRFTTTSNGEGVEVET